MAIRDRFRRAMHKSESSSTSDTISQTESNTTTTTANTSETSSLHKSTSSKLARTFTFGRRGGSDEAKEAKRNKKNKKIHPSQRPLTLQNLKHQEMLSQFTMTFGASDPEQIESLSFIGVSPCCTRAPSLEIDRSSDLGLSPTDSPSPAYSVRD